MYVKLGKLCAVVGAAGLTFGSSLVYAQAVLEAPPPTRSALDARSVDLVTGAFTFSMTDVAIGQPGQGGLSYGRTWVGPGYRDTAASTANSSGSIMTISFGGSSDAFNILPGGLTYSPVTDRGQSLVRSSGQLIYTASDGTVATFNTGIQFNISGQPASNSGRLVSIAYPNGELVNYNYVSVSLPPPFDPPKPIFTRFWRLASISNNRGYQIKFEYEIDDPEDITQRFPWQHRIKATAFNMAVDACDPMASHCTFSRTWPSATYGSGTVTDQVGRTTTITASGGITSVKLPSSTTPDITLTYDGLSRVSSLETGGGQWTYTYSDVGTTRTTTVTDLLSNQVVAVGDLTTSLLSSVRDGAGNTTSFQYDTQGRRTRVTRPEGDYAQYTYGPRGNVATVTQVAKAGSGLPSIVTGAAYPATCANPKTCNQPTSITDARGAVTDYTYDAGHGGVLTVTEPAPTSGAVRPQTRLTYETHYAWYKNAAGVLTQAPSPVSYLATMSACATAASCAGTADESRTVFNYGASGVANNRLPTSVTHRDGTGALSATTATTWSVEGDILSVDGPLAGADDTTHFRYDLARQRVGAIGPDPDGSGPLKRRAVRTTYNADGLPTLAEQGTVDGLTDPDWAAFASLQQIATAYDDWGRPVHASVSGGGTTYGLQQTSYDLAGRVDCVATRMNPSTFGSSPASACALGMTGAHGPDRIIRTTYNAAGRLASTVSGVGTLSTLTESITYTANGLPQTLTDANGNVSTLVYDGFDRLSRMRYPNASGGGSSTTDYEEYGYDAASNVVTLRDRAGGVISSGYDSLNRQVSMGGSAIADRTFTYDNLGRIKTGVFVSGGPAFSNTWDALGRLISETQNPIGTISYGYDAAGRRTRITWPDAFYASYDYDLYSAPTAVRENGATSGAGVLATYAYDNLGRRTGVTRGNGVATSYGYDGGSRLTSLTQNLSGTSSDLTLAYAYNPAGQIVTRTASNLAYVHTPPVGSTAYVNNGRNQVTSAGGSSVTYDGRQNITGTSSGSYGYDGLNQLTSATVGGVVFGASYDTLGRLQQYADGATTRLLYDGVQAVGEYDSSNALIRRYIPGLGVDETVAAYDATGVGSRSWLLADERGSVIALTDGSGAAASINTYDDYGVPGAGNAGRFQYTGQMWLSSVGLYHYKARAYAPDLGRFMQPDPIGYAGGANLYAYVGADPVNLVDSMGLRELMIYKSCSGRWNGVDGQGNQIWDMICSEVIWWDPGQYSIFPGGNILIPDDIGGFSSLEDLRNASVPHPAYSDQCRQWQLGQITSDAAKIGQVGGTATTVAGLGALGIAPITGPFAVEVAVGGAAAANLGWRIYTSSSTLEMLGAAMQAGAGDPIPFATGFLSGRFASYVPGGRVGQQLFDLSNSYLSGQISNERRTPCD